MQLGRALQLKDVGVTVNSGGAMAGTCGPLTSDFCQGLSSRTFSPRIEWPQWAHDTQDDRVASDLALPEFADSREGVQL